MTTTTEVLKASDRGVIGTGGARAVRRLGKIPATLYGKGKEPLSISLDSRETSFAYHRGMFTSKIFEIDLNGKKIKVVPKRVDLHPVKDTIDHIDLMYLNDDFQVVEVPIVFTNQDKSPGVKKGGFFNVVIRKLRIQCPVQNVISHVSMSIENMHVGYKIKASDFVLPEGCKLMTPAKTIIASITGRASQETEQKNETDAAAATQASAAKK